MDENEAKVRIEKMKMEHRQEMGCMSLIGLVFIGIGGVYFILGMKKKKEEENKNSDE